MFSFAFVFFYTNRKCLPSPTIIQSKEAGIRTLVALDEQGGKWSEMKPHTYH